MGITISHKIGIADKKTVLTILDNTEKCAGLYQQEAMRRGIKMAVERRGPLQLHVNIGGCETLAFNFRTPAEIIAEKEKDGYSYEYAVLSDDGKKELEAGYKIDEFPQNEIFYSADFCKTQFAGDIWEHKAVSDLIKTVAGRAKYAEINDEAYYYYTGDIEQAGREIASLGAMITGLGTQLEGLGYEVQGGKTIIKN